MHLFFGHLSHMLAPEKRNAFCILLAASPKTCKCPKCHALKRTMQRCGVHDCCAKQGRHVRIAPDRLSISFGNSLQTAFCVRMIDRARRLRRGAPFISLCFFQEQHAPKTRQRKKIAYMYNAIRFYHRYPNKEILVTHAVHQNSFNKNHKRCRGFVCQLQVVVAAAALVSKSEYV